MLYGICNLSIVPLRESASDTSEMVSQVLFGESFEIIEKQKEWSKIQLTFDNYEGFIDNKQYIGVTEEFYSRLKSEDQFFSGEMVDFISNEKNELTTIPLGSNLPLYNNSKLLINDQWYLYEGTVLSGRKQKSEILKIAFTYLNSPFLSKPILTL